MGLNCDKCEHVELKEILSEEVKDLGVVYLLECPKCKKQVVW